MWVLERVCAKVRRERNSGYKREGGEEGERDCETISW
jgi:hypothetical protein